MENREWRYQAGDQRFLVSTTPALLPDSQIQEFFATPAMYWATPVDPEELVIMRKNSVLLGLYLEKDKAGDAEPSAADLEPIGMARLVTDHMAIIFLTDVYVLPEHQGKGLGKWLVRCVADLAKATPRLRRVMLMAKNEPHATKFYDDLLDAKVFDQVNGGVVFMSSKMVGLDS